MPASRPTRLAQLQAVWIASSSLTGDHLVDQLAVEHRRDEARADALDAVRSGASAREHRRAARLDRDDPQLRVGVLAQVLAHAGDRARRCPLPPRARPRCPSSARSISGPVVRRWASGLAGLENWSGRNTSVVARHRAGGLDRLAHPPQRLRDVHARAIQPQQALALAAHPLRQRQHQLIALGRAHERQRDPRVAAGGLDDRRAARLDPALPPRPPRSSPRRCGP